MKTLSNGFQSYGGDYSHNSYIWHLRRDWEQTKDVLLSQLNDGSYEFDFLDPYEFDDGTISLWSSQDMIALKLITQVLGNLMNEHIPKSCYHIKDHGGLKKAVVETFQAVPDHQYVMRSDIKGYYASIQLNVLMGIIESYVNNLILLTLLRKALRRTETRGGLFYEYFEKGIPKGSPLSPLLGAIALIPLDKAIGAIQGIFYARFMDDWVVLTKSKTALRKVIKITHKVIRELKLQLHPKKTYIGKICKGFNFLAYYMDHQKILPSQETIRRFHERTVALYEKTQGNRNISRRSKENFTHRDISEYQTNEPAPTNVSFQKILTHLLSRAAQKPDILGVMRRYIDKWASWIKLGLSTIQEFEACVSTHLPVIFSCWIKGACFIETGNCR